MKITSFKEASLLRRFTILFIVMSILPIAVLYYFYAQIRDTGTLEVSPDSFNTTLILIVLGVSVGYFAMRSVIRDLMKMTKASTQTIQQILGPEKIKNIDEDENEITVLTRSFDIVTSRLKENIKNLELAKKTLHSVLERVGSGISSMQNIDSFLELILETVTEAANAKVGILVLRSEETGVPKIQTVYGASFNDKENLREPLGNLLKAVAKAKGTKEIPDLEAMAFPEETRRNLFVPPLLCAPLFLHDKIIGAIAVSKHKEGKPFTKDEQNLLNNVSSQTAVALENARLNQDAERTYFETISALALAVEAKDMYSRGHLDRVAEYAIKIAKKLNLNEEDLAILRDAARLHDIGKIGIYDDILKKPGKLSPEEREMISKHPAVGESIIKPIHSLRPLCDIVRHHHERLDGSGYPDGLKGDEISLLTRILTVADIYDALTTDRPYRKASSREEAKKILEDMEGQLDPKVVEALFRVA